MSNIPSNPSSATPSKGPQKLSPNSIASRLGFEIAADEATTAPRAADDSKGKQPTKGEDKPITDRAISSNEVSQKEPTEAAQNVNKAVEVKRKEIQERAFTTFSLENWDEKQIDDLANLARNSNKKLLPYKHSSFIRLGSESSDDEEVDFDFINNYDFSRSKRHFIVDDSDETDSYDQETSYIRRVFLEGSPQHFKEIESKYNPFSDDGSLMRHPLVNSALSYIYELLPGEMRPERDRIEVSLIRQCAPYMEELPFHQDRMRQVFVIVLACNFEDGAEMSVKDGNKILSEKDVILYKFLKQPLPVVENPDYYYSNIPSAKGNGYLINEFTESTRDKKQSVFHRRGAYSTHKPGRERITLRILIDSKDEPIREVK